MKTRVSLKFFVSYCLRKLCFDSNLPQAPSNLIFLTFLVALRTFALFEPKISGKKVLKFVLLGNCFPDLFTEVEIWY